MGNITKRPGRNSQDVRRAACTALMESLDEWSDDHGLTVGELMRHADDCGYQFAKNLDDANLIDPDAGLVEILDTYQADESTAYHAAVKQWVTDNGITLPEWAVVGARVRVTCGWLTDAPGVVTGTGPDDATLTVLPDGKAEKGMLGYIFPFDQVSQEGGAA